jgi:hypothetical protein
MNPYDKYEFHLLIDIEKEVLESMGFTWIPDYVFVHEDYSFTNFLINYPIRERMTTIYNDIEPIVIINKRISSNKLCPYEGFSTCQYGQNFCYGIYSPCFRQKYMNHKEKIILYSKNRYFHEFIFNLREACKNDLPEDIIKLIISTLLISTVA